MLSVIDTRASRVLFTALLFALALGFIYMVRRTLVAFLFAIFFAYLMEPAVSRMEKLLRGRSRAIAAIYTLLLAVVVIILAVIGPQIVHQGQRLSESLPVLMSNVTSGHIAEQIGAEHGWSAKTIDQFRSLLKNHEGTITEMAQRIGLRMAEVAQQSWLVLVVPILAIFFLRDGRAFSQVMISLVHSRAQREFLEGVLGDLNRMLAHFIRAQLTLAALSLLAYLAFLGLMRVPYALVLGTAGGLMEFVPVVGPLMAALLILGVALLTSYPHWLWLLVFLGVWRGLQDYAIAPRVMGERMELHPLAAIFGVLAGGEIAGVLGVYLSIPVMASLRIVVRRWRLFIEKRRFGPLNEYAFGGEIAPRK